jgi:WD40 repeat protein
LLFLSAGLVACGSSQSTANGARDAGAEAEASIDAGVDADAEAYKTTPKSCDFTCPVTTCGPYVCPSMAAWDALPHEAICPAWDGGPGPNSAPSKCTASAPSGDTVKYAGPDPAAPSATYLPDGRRVQATGSEWLFDEPNLTPGLPMSVTVVPGTSYVLVVDAGYGAHSVRSVDTTMIGGAMSPVVSYVEFDAPETLNWPLAFVPPNLVLVATDDGVVQAITMDTTTGILTRADDQSIALPTSVDDTGNPGNYYVGGLAVSPDETKLVVSGVFDERVLVFDLTTGDYGKQLGAVMVGNAPSFAAAFDPNDASGQYAYVALAGNSTVAEIDVSTPSSPTLTRSFTTDKNPQAFAFLNARFMLVANDFGDTMTLVDRVADTSSAIPVDVSTTLHGKEPTSLAYDATRQILYATVAAYNAVGAWSVNVTDVPPAITPLGRLPTSWWPSSVAVLADSSLAITTMRGHGDGPLDMQYAVGGGNAMAGVRGGVQLVPTPSASDFTSGETAVTAGFEVGQHQGAPAVSCPAGEDDFPVPPTNTSGPSKKIQHIFLVVRENKTFDALLGDIPTVNGDPSLTMKTSTADMDRLWANFRDLVRTFATGDNYYTSAELSIQGHTWTTFGRTSDFTERTWSISNYSRSVYNSEVQPQGVASYGTPVEGSAFQWLIEAGVPTDILGEAEGMPTATSATHPSIDLSYPGGFIQNIGYPDNEKACHVASRARVFCNLGQFTYMTFPNDHTLGVSPTQASPEAMVAVNDEATGMLVDAISHSPEWASSLIFVTEDDPAGGGDHIEHHRTPLVVVSPWVRRAYVSKTHMDIASIHKIAAHVLGLPYPNAIVASAALPLDLFTGTPDFAPYTYTPRQWPLSCGEMSTLAERRLTASWDFSEVDSQPGLDAQVLRYMRGTQLPDDGNAGDPRGGTLRSPR